MKLKVKKKPPGGRLFPVGTLVKLVIPGQGYVEAEITMAGTTSCKVSRAVTVKGTLVYHVYHREIGEVFVNGDWVPLDQLRKAAQKKVAPVRRLRKLKHQSGGR